MFQCFLSLLQMEVNDHQNCLVSNILQKIVCSAEESHTGLEWCEGEQIMTVFYFCGELFLGEAV